jgi:peroxiredoxin
MKNLLILFALMLTLACGQPGGFKIELALQGGNGKVYLLHNEGGRWLPRDSSEFKNGVAVFKGKVDFPDLYIIQLAGGEQRAIMFVENANIKVTGKADSVQSVTISGSPVNDEYQSIKSGLEQDDLIARAKYQEYQAAMQAGDTLKAGSLMKEVSNLMNNSEKKMLDFIKANPSSWVNPLILAQVQSTLSMESLDSLMNLLDPRLIVSPIIKQLKDQLAVLKKVGTGQTAPDFTMNDPDGKPVKMSDVISKNSYTLIDFWAAWCSPCRHENPNVVAAFTRFKPKGFSVFGVSLDQDRNRWLKAIADDKLTWTHVSDLKYWQNEAARLYAVTSIPANFLVDKTGKIVARNLRGEDLMKKLEELLP